MWIKATGPLRVPFLHPPEAPPDTVSVEEVVPPVKQLPPSIQPGHVISPTSAMSGSSNVSPLTPNEISRYESTPL